MPFGWASPAGEDWRRVRDHCIGPATADRCGNAGAPCEYVSPALNATHRDMLASSEFQETRMRLFASGGPHMRPPGTAWQGSFRGNPSKAQSQAPRVTGWTTTARLCRPRGGANALRGPGEPTVRSRWGTRPACRAPAKRVDHPSRCGSAHLARLGWRWPWRGSIFGGI